MCRQSFSRIVVVLILVFAASGSFADLINEIQIEGTTHVNPSEILKVIKTKVGDDLQKPSTVWTIRKDIQSIWELDYFSNIAVSDEKSETGWNLIFLVEEKPLLKDINFQGNRRHKKRKLNKEIGFEPTKKKVFYDEAVAEDFEKKLQSFYTDQSFPNTKVSWRVEESRQDNTVEMIFDVQEGARLPVRDIQFTGNQALEVKEFKRALQTKKTWWFIKRHYDEQTVQDDCDRIRMVYWDHGYIDAQVTPGPVEEIDGKGLRVQFEIVEGQPYTVGNVTLEGNSIFSTEELAQHITLQAGDTFSVSKLQNSEMTMRNLYRAQGYLDTYFPPLDSQLMRDTKNLVVDIHIPITESPRKYLGDVEIQGVVVMEDGAIEPVEEGEFKTKEKVIQREIGLTTGEPIDWTKVIESDRDLVNLNFFKSRPYPAPGQLNLIPGFQRRATDDPQVDDLILQLEEIQTGAIQFGGGYSTSYGPTVFVSVSERNLFGLGLRGSTTAEVGTLRNRFAVELEDPYFMGYDLNADWKVYYIDQEGYGGRSFDEERIGSAVTFGYEINDDLDFLVGFKGEQTDLKPDSGHRYALDPSTIPEEYNLGENVTTSMTVGFVHDLRDFKMNPSSGTYLRSTVEVAGLTDNEFVKWSNLAHYYEPVMEKLILALSTEVDLAHAYGDPGFVPLQERFFIGGGRTVRGFDEGGIGQYASIWYADHRLGGFRSYLGGEAAWVNNAELRYGFNEMLQGVVFLDAGTSWPEIGDIDPSELRVSTGVGLRVYIPGFNATFRIDFPFVLRKFDEDDTQFFHFSFGQTF
ncbi:MAG: outer membrane protein assembly factor BamA [bacterium]|nr:outer membrane protein assembly factor BamA [bacterium]